MVRPLTSHLAATVCVGSVLLLAACQDDSQPTGPQAASPAPVAFSSTKTQKIPDRYIVVFRSGVTDVQGVAVKLAKKHGGTLSRVYTKALRGMALKLPDARATALRAEPEVAYVEQDQVAHIITTESNATWGLDRVDQRSLPLNTTYVYNADGSNVKAYIIDTGIRFDHSDFGSPTRAQKGVDEVTLGGTAADCNGHGTHVAGTVGGTTYGIAKKVSLYAVRVLDCSGSGTYEGVIAGIDWVTANHGSATAVANMSLGGGFSQALNDAVQNSIASGVVYAVAAGNGDIFGNPQDACTVSPASTPNALTIGATDQTDVVAYFSNYGTCVDMLAPGVSVTSDWYTSATATNTISGTSMATPHVTGAAAAYLSSNPTATPAQVASALTSNASTNKISGLSNGTPNLLLYTGFITGGGSCVPGTPDASASTVAATSPVNVNQSSTVTVTVLDACGGPLAGATVAISVSGAGTNTVTQPSSPTNSSGVATGSFTSSASGTKTVSATANGTALTQTANVTVNTTSVAVHFAALSGAKTSQAKQNWKATATVMVQNASSALVSGATATLALSGGASGTVSCTTGADGQCSAVATVRNRFSSVTFTEQNIQGSGMTYAPNQPRLAATVSK